MWHAHSIICHCYLISQMAWWLRVGEVEAITPHSPARLPCVPKVPWSSNAALDEWFLHAHLCCGWECIFFCIQLKKTKAGEGQWINCWRPLLSKPAVWLGWARENKKNWILDGFPLGRIHGYTSALETLVRAQFSEWKIFLTPTTGYTHEIKQKRTEWLSKPWRCMGESIWAFLENDTFSRTLLL